MLPASSGGIGGLFHLEMQRYQREHEGLQVLHEIVEDAESFRIGRFLDVDEGANLGGFEGDVFVTQADFEFLAAVFILLWPFRIVFPVVV